MSSSRAEFKGFVKRLSVPLSLLLFVLVFGSGGYYLLWRSYDATLLDAIYMTFITVTTVGYSEIHPLSSLGRVFTILIAITGIASLFYMFSAVMESLVARQLRDPYGRRKVQRTISALSDHIILAGFGRMGQRVAEELRHEATPFVVVTTARSPKRSPPNVVTFSSWVTRKRTSCWKKPA